MNFALEKISTHCDQQKNSRFSLGGTNGPCKMCGLTFFKLFFFKFKPSENPLADFITSALLKPGQNFRPSAWSNYFGFQIVISHSIFIEHLPPAPLLTFMKKIFY